MKPSLPKPEAAAAKSLIMAMEEAKKFLHLFAEGALSFFAFLLSIFIYLSVFNFTSFPTHDLLNDTKFWFCISNTLIFIIALDFGAFSPPPPPNFHGGGQYRRIIHAAKIPNQPNPEDHSSKIINVKEPPTKELVTIPDLKLNGTKSYQRSKSEKVKNKRVVDDEKERKMMRRSKTTIRHDDASSSSVSTKEKEEKKNEFAEMTDEELNRRVEEFIERFNRQIRLQEIGHGHDHELKTVPKQKSLLFLFF